MNDEIEAEFINADRAWDIDRMLSEIASLRAEVAEWKAKFADLHIAHGAIEQSLKQQDAEVEQLRRERDEANDRATCYGNMARMVLDQQKTTEELDRMLKELGV
jgi:predicted RNase H-like nuclease (RuvC/YqgF family)